MCSTVSIPPDATTTRPVAAPAPLEALEREITALASRIHAATCRWLGLVAEYDRREGWAQWGCRSCAHWVSWQCGIAPVAAREHVRVARRLEELPLVRDAFSEGRLSFSKVRALTRVGDVEREEELLELAQHATAAQLERLVRAYRGVVAVERVAAGGRPERWLDCTHDDDGSVLLRARLPAEEGAIVLAALEAAKAQLVAAGESASAEAPGRPAWSADATAAAGESASAEAPEPPAWSAQAAAPLGEGASAEAPVPSPAEARADALVLMADSFLATGAVARTGGDRHQVVVHVDVATLSGGDSGGQCELADGSPLAAETARRLACDAGIVPLAHLRGRPLGVGRKTRSIPPALRRALAARDRGCRFPGCDRRHVDAHHIHHWARGGATDLGNLVQLCRHHHRLVHEGGFAVERPPGGTIVFRTPDGRRIAGCPAHPHGRPSALLSSQRRPVASDACVPLSGDRLNLDLGVAAMLAFAPPDRRRSGSGPPGEQAGAGREAAAAA